jgi:hypothetical protein
MIVCFALFAVAQTHAQDSTKTLKSLLENKQFSFQPTNMLPVRGTLKQLSPGYFLKLRGDSLISYLPYFGRAYSAPINPEDAGYNFISTNFTYTVKAGKKNSYEVEIATKDKTNNINIILTAYDNGSADLRMNSADKQPISYNGYIRK